MESLVLSNRSSLRYHGDLDSVTDSERRGLRPIGAGIRDVAARTGTLLGALMVRSAVHIFQGVRPVGRDGPSIPHVVIAGRHVVFVESVTWPSGCYSVENTDRIHCDDVYIGQSIRPLMATVNEWRETLPIDHCVSALVVVHPADDGVPTLPGARVDALRWTHPQSIARDLCGLLPTGNRTASPCAFAALAAASAQSEAAG